LNRGRCTDNHDGINRRIPTRLEQKRYVQNRQPDPVRLGADEIIEAAASHERMDNGFQSVKRGFISAERLGQTVPVHRPVDHDTCEGFTNRADCCAARRIQGMDGGVGVPDHCPKVCKHGCRGRLAHTD
jgi:hypothetical protein